MVAHVPVPQFRQLFVVLCFSLLTAGTAFSGMPSAVPPPAGFFSPFAFSAKVDQLGVDIDSLQATIGIYVTAAQKVDKDLQYVIQGIDLVDKLTSDLKRLDKSLTTVEDLLDVAKGIPQTHDEAQALSDGITSIHPQVTDAANTADRINKKLQPIGVKLDTADQRLQRLIQRVQDFQKRLNEYKLHMSNAQNCINSLPDGDVKTGLQTRLDQLAALSDRRIVQANTLLQKIISVINDIEQAIESKIKKELEPLSAIADEVEKLADKLDDLVNPLHDLAALLKKSFGTKFPYPTFKGIKWYHLSIGFDVIIKGTDAIEREIEHILGKALYKAAKLFGIKKLVEDLTHAADDALDGVRKELHMDFKVEVPGLGTLETDLQNLEADLQSLDPKLNIDIDPLEQLLDQIEADVREMKNIYENCHKP